jgi:hypothetical protein
MVVWRLSYEIITAQLVSHDHDVMAHVGLSKKRLPSKSGWEDHINHGFSVFFLVNVLLYSFGGPSQKMVGPCSLEVMMDYELNAKLCDFGLTQAQRRSQDFFESERILLALACVDICWEIDLETYSLSFSWVCFLPASGCTLGQRNHRKPRTGWIPSLHQNRKSWSKLPQWTLAYNASKLF